MLTTISDRRQQVSAGGVNVDSYTADVQTAQDYYPFGMQMPGRNFSANGSYRYGFNGQEKSDEIKGNGNSYTAEFWEYDPRSGRRWNVDPEEKRYPNQSPYAVFDGNPILKNDPDGRSGIVTIDRQAKTLTVTSRFIFYGNESNPALTNKIVKNIEDQWNAANGTAKIKVGVDKKGNAIYETYKVKFKFDAAETRTQYGLGDKILSALSDRKSLEQEIKTNTDYRNNYIRVEKNTSQDVSYYDGSPGGNTGMFKLANVTGANSTTESHEYGHGLGLIPGTPDGHPATFDLRGKGQPTIMHARGTLVDAPYTYNPALGASTVVGGKGVNTLDPEKRKVTQEDIDALGLGNLQYDANGNANLGKLTNTYHKKGD